MENDLLKILRNALDGIKLTEDEERLIKWIAGWDLSTVQILSQLFIKCQKSKTDI